MRSADPEAIWREIGRIADEVAAADARGDIEEIVRLQRRRRELERQHKAATAELEGGAQ